MIKFNIFGTNVRISFLAACLVMWTLIYDQHKTISWVLFSSAFHEICHIISVYLFYSKPISISFEISGIRLLINEELTGLKELIVLSSGCIGNIILFILSCKFGSKTGAIVNMLLIMFNMLPSMYLDGGKILFGLFSSFLRYETAEKTSKTISIMGSMILIIIGIIFLFKLRNPTILVTGSMLIITSTIQDYIY